MLVAKELRNLTEEQLNINLREMQNEHQKLLQNKHSKKVEPNDIKIVRKDIARIKTIMYEKKVEKMIEEFKGKKFIPKELRIKKTRALRRALTKNQKNMMSRNQRIIRKKYPKVIFSFIN
ncbi:hypothetical protein NUSPORA_02128 [Nucleospora cyclopteri]